MLTIDLKAALAEASACPIPDSASDQERNSLRSRQWVQCLAKAFRKLYPDPAVRVFYKGDPSNRDDFGLNELLYDVCVCETDTCPAAVSAKTLRYVTRALWQIESEFARDSSEAVKDFNKLVIGAAENKLFVWPRLSTPDRERDYLETLLPVASRCTGAVYAALVPHPSDWRAAQADVLAWRLDAGRWQAI